MGLSGKIEFAGEEDARRCFRPAVPTLPSLDDVHDLLAPATRNITEFDRLLADRGQDGAVGRLFARLDAVHSSGAEGSTTTFTDLLEYESSAKSAPDPEDAAGVGACSDAFEAETRTGNGNLVDATLRIHRRLFERSRNPAVSVTAGRWKERINGTADTASPGGFFYYTKPSSVPAAMEEFRHFVNEKDPRVPELVRQIAAHWMFEHIHPVADGNGRIGRLLVPLAVKGKGSTKTACVFLGEAVHEDKQTYVEALKEARIAADWTGWTRLLLQYSSETAVRNIGRIEALSALEKEWRAHVKGFRSHSVVHRLVTYAVTHPVFTVNDAVADLKTTFASVNTAASHLAKAGILSIADGARRDRLFEAAGVLALFDRFRTRHDHLPIP